MVRLYQTIAIFICSLIVAGRVLAADPLAARIRTDTSNFNSSLSVADINVQKSLDTLDNLSIMGNVTFVSVIWAEEGLALSTGTSGGKQWSYGNGDVLTNGITMGFNGSVVGMSIQSTYSNSTAGKVDITLNGTDQAGEYNITTPGVNNGTVYKTFGTPLNFTTNSTLGFQTVANSSGTNQTRVAIYTQQSSPITGLKGDTGATGAAGEVAVTNVSWVDNRLVKTDGTDTTLIQESGITVSDANDLSGISNISATGNITSNNFNAGNITMNGTMRFTGTSPTIRWNNDSSEDWYMQAQTATNLTIGDVTEFKTTTAVGDMDTGTQSSGIMLVAQENITINASGWFCKRGITLVNCNAAVTAGAPLENSNTAKQARTGRSWVEGGYMLGTALTTDGSAPYQVTAYVESTYVPAASVP